MTKSTDKAQTEPDKESSAPKLASTDIPADSKRDDQHFWRALKKDDEIQTLHKASPVNRQPESNNKPTIQSAKPIDLMDDADNLSEVEREHRRQALRSMLAASEARQQSALRARRPTPEAGLRVGVRNGPLKGREGTILDADYIESRVLLDMEDGQDPQWVEFARLHSLIVN